MNLTLGALACIFDTWIVACPSPWKHKLEKTKIRYPYTCKVHGYFQRAAVQNRHPGTVCRVLGCRMNHNKIRSFLPSPNFICSLVQNIWYVQDMRYQHKILCCWLSVTSGLSEAASLIVTITVMAALSFLSEGIFFLWKYHSASVQGSFKHIETM